MSESLIEYICKETLLNFCQNKLLRKMFSLHGTFNCLFLKHNLAQQSKGVSKMLKLLYLVPLFTSDCSHCVISKAVQRIKESPSKLQALTKTCQDFGNDIMEDNEKSFEFIYDMRLKVLFPPIRYPVSLSELHHSLCHSADLLL